MTPETLLERYYHEHDGQDLNLKDFLHTARSGRWGDCSVETALSFLALLEELLQDNLARAQEGHPSGLSVETAQNAVTEEMRDLRDFVQSTA